MENHIGKIIEKNRKSRGWSRQYLADKLGVNVSMISFYERGVKIPSDKKKMILCEIFNLTWSELVGESPEATLKKEITKLLFEMDLSKNELKVILDKITNFYCNNGLYNDFKDFYIGNNFVNTNKVKNAINKIELLFFDFFREEIYQKKDRKQVITFNEISEYIQKNFSNTLDDIIKKIDEKEILHELFINVYKEIDEEDINAFNEELLADVKIEGYIPFSNDLKDYKNLFALLVTIPSYTDRYRYNDVVIFKKQDDILYGEDILISFNGKLQIVKINLLQEKSIMIYTSENDFDIYSNKDLKKNNFKILGVPLEIKINYFSRNNDI